MAYQVLAFGDSLTWGHAPETLQRHAKNDRWPQALAETLHATEIIEEGLRGRTTVFPREEMPSDMRGSHVLPVCLSSHAPLDMVVIMLGSNDVYIGISVSRIGRGMQRLIEIIRGYPYGPASVPDIVIIAPPRMVPAADVTSDMITRSAGLSAVYHDLAQEFGCGFFDAGTVAQASPIDGIHLDAHNTRTIGAHIAPLVAQRLQNR